MGFPEKKEAEKQWNSRSRGKKKTEERDGETTVGSRRHDTWDSLSPIRGSRNLRQAECEEDTISALFPEAAGLLSS
jgi:hypothetical protein